MSDRNLNLVISEAARKLEKVGIEAGAAEAELILCDLLDCTRLHLFLQGSMLLNDALMEKFNAIVEKRLTRYPLQYILGSSWFFGRKFKVNEAVMVPCPETEILMDSVLRSARFCPSTPVKILDIGTGSGVLALTLKLENPELDITAVDISEEALAVARENAARFKIESNVRLCRSDLFAAIAGDEKFDIIASNPPYITIGDYEGLPPEVKADPQVSLLAGDQGLDVIERILTEAPDYLNVPGYLIFEVGDNQAEGIFEIVDQDKRYSDCLLIKDLADIDRIVLCKVK
ncbi:MAG: peptide chain release factor N(5)-glutamine methyltransferase [FCB group bacterium]|nr:peptide chain release factor N(5)-glutamine methyltransferase [FCB group bacterium]